MSRSFCVVLTTTGSQSEADAIAELLVSRQLAACVQITRLSSVYTWNGSLHKDAEFLLLIKTAARRYDEVDAAIRENHSYEVPEIIQLPVERGSRAYLDWISASTG